MRRLTVIELPLNVAQIVFILLDSPDFPRRHVVDTAEFRKQLLASPHSASPR